MFLFIAASVGFRAIVPVVAVNKMSVLFVENSIKSLSPVEISSFGNSFFNFL